MSEARRPCRKCGRNRAERFFTSARGHTCSTCRKRRVQYASREQRLMEVHYITLEEYDEMLEAQGGVCAICGGKRPYFLDVDHDHAVEKSLLALGASVAHAHRASIRGLLCKVDNRRLLPAAKDNFAILLRAIDYLEHWPSDAVLGAPQWVS